MNHENESSAPVQAGNEGKPWLFPLVICGLYMIGYGLAPGSTGKAMHICAVMFKQLAIPVSVALVMMVVLNRYLSPAVVTQFLGKHSGVKGVVLSSCAGILSMGPVYAWYPLLKTMREKGASTFHIVNFIGNRSVKPVLLPVLVGYWGWRFASLFVLVSIAGALLSACIVSALFGDLQGTEGDSESQ